MFTTFKSDPNMLNLVCGIIGISLIAYGYYLYFYVPKQEDEKEE